MKGKLDQFEKKVKTFPGFCFFLNTQEIYKIIYFCNYSGRLRVNPQAKT